MKKSVGQVRGEHEIHELYTIRIVTIETNGFYLTIAYAITISYFLLLI